MIKFTEDKIIYTRTIKTKKHKKLLLRFEIENIWYLRGYKQMFEEWKDHIERCCENQQFKNNIVTERYFR